MLVSSVLVVLIIIGFILQSRLSQTSKGIIIDGYGDKVETSIYGEPIQEDSVAFTLVPNYFCYRTFSTDQNIKIRDKVAIFIKENVNLNESKAVMQESVDAKLVDRNIYTTFEIRTNDNKDTFTTTVIQNDNNEPTQLIFKYKDVTKTVDIM